MKPITTPAQEQLIYLQEENKALRLNYNTAVCDNRNLVQDALDSRAALEQANEQIEALEADIRALFNDRAEAQAEADRYAEALKRVYNRAVQVRDADTPPVDDTHWWPGVCDIIEILEAEL